MGLHFCTCVAISYCAVGLEALARWKIVGGCGRRRYPGVIVCTFFLFDVNEALEGLFVDILYQ